MAAAESLIGTSGPILHRPSLTAPDRGRYHPLALLEWSAMNRSILRVVLVVVAVVIAAAGGYLVHARFSRTGPVDAAAVKATPGPTVAEALQQSFVGVAQQVRPAVVHLGTIERAKARRGPSAPPGSSDDPFFQDFFNQFFGSEGPGARARSSGAPGWARASSSTSAASSSPTSTSSRAPTRSRSASPTSANTAVRSWAPIPRRTWRSSASRPTTR